MPTAFRLPPTPVHSTVPRVKAVDGLRKEFTHLTNINPNGARVIYVTGLPGTGKKTVCSQYGEEFLRMGGEKKRIVSTWNLETPESLFRSLCDLAVMMGSPANTETVIRRKCHLMTKRIKTAKRIYESKKHAYKLLLILTNVGQQMKNLRQYWPQHGDEQWGDTQVLLCVDDVGDLGLTDAEINELSLNGGLIESQSLTLLQTLSGKKDDEEGAKYLLKELNYHPMSIAHTAIFLKSVLQNPDNSGFGWKDCLVRIERLKMGTVGRYNTKQSLALTTILENNHAVSEMAINRLGSVNPFLESAFTFLAFCDRDDIFSIPVEVISNYVMDGLKTDDDVDNCKMENTVKATIRSCPLFLVPRATITVQTQAVKNTLPPDTDGIFQSQLPPRTDLLPEIGDGSLTAAVMKEISSVSKADESSKEVVKEATEPPSRPATQEKKAKSRPATQEAKAASRPATQEAKAASRPATQEKKAESRPATQDAKAASRPATQEAKAASRPATQEKKADSRPATQEVKSESRPATQEKKAESRPATQEAKAESRPATQEKKAESRPATQEAKAESRPATQEKKAESRPATQDGKPDEKKDGSRPPTQEAKTDEIKMENRLSIGEHPPASPEPENKGQSRPATQEKSKAEENPIEVKSAPPTPEPEKKQKTVVETEEVDEDSAPKAESGEVKPLNAEPPTVESGEFKPLMAEPPRPKTPMEKAKEAAQMSASIEKPGIDGRNSAADRVVEANVYGNELIAGEVPIMRREGSVVVNVEDTLRSFEDEVDAITFNNSVHNAMRNFARNAVLRKVKGGQSSSSAPDTVAQQRKLQLQQFVQATKVLLLTYEKIYESKEPTDLAMKRMLGPQLQYFVNCMLTKFNFKNRVSVRALKFYADSLLLLGELIKAEEALETAQNIAFQCFNPTDLDLFDILRDRANVLARLGEKEETAGVLEQCITIIEQLDGEDMLVKESELLNELAQVHGNIGNLSYANNLLQRSLSIQESLHGSMSLEICDTLSRLAMLRNKMGEPSQAHSQLQRVMRIQERHDVPRHQFSGTLCNMAAVNAALGEHEKSKVLYQSVLATQERQYGQWYPEIATTLSNLAMVHMALGEYEEAKDCLQRTHRIRSRVYGKKHPLVASTLTNLASVVFTMGDMKESMKLNEDALEIQKACYPDAHPLVAVTLKNMAMIENSIGNLDKAKSLYERVLRMEELIYGELHPAVASTLNNLADTVLEQGETAKAAVLFQRAMETNEIVFGKDHPDIARNLNNLGRAFKEMGDYDGAKTKLTMSLQMKEKRYGDDHINLVPTLMNLGDLFNLTKQPSRAKDVLTRGLKIIEKKIGMKHPDSAKLLRLLGNSFYLMGDLATSEKLLNKSLDILEGVYENDHPYILATRADLGACSRPVGARVF
ncbi:hypothetical protein ACHWQZ_G001347 [Mnemiopsis leidyi]